jgi:hypothetical protein
MGFSVTRNTYTNTVEPIKTQDTFGCWGSSAMRLINRLIIIYIMYGYNYFLYVGQIGCAVYLLIVSSIRIIYFLGCLIKTLKSCRYTNDSPNLLS